MLIVLPAVALAIAIALHAALCRLPIRLSIVVRFLLAGTVVGVVLLIVALRVFKHQNAGTVGIACVLCLYAAACELYIFLFSSVGSSLGSQTLLILAGRERDAAGLEATGGGAAQFDRRMDDLVAQGLLEHDGSAVSKRGRQVAHLLRRLRLALGRPAPLAALAAPFVPQPRRRQPWRVLAALFVPRPRHQPWRLPAALPLTRSDLLALLLLTALVVAYFWPYVTGAGVFIGDSDRLNHHLTTLAYQLDGLREGVLRTWSDRMFGGYSLMSLPFVYPNPLNLLALLWPREQLFQAATALSGLVLALVAWAGYAFLRDLVRDRSAAFIGAALYGASALPVRMIGGADSTTLAFIFLPLILLAVRRVDPVTAVRQFLFLTLWLGLLFIESFLQWAAYIAAFAGVYAIWLSVIRRSWMPTVVTLLAGTTATLFTLPRVVDNAIDFSQGARGIARPFADVFAANRVAPYEILRLFDAHIFGDDFSQVLSVGNNINLHEGAIIYQSAFAVVLLALSIKGYIAAKKKRDFPKNDCERESVLFIFVFFSIFFFTMTKIGYYITYNIFLRADFLHARMFVLTPILYSSLIAGGFVWLRTAGGDTVRRIGPLVAAAAAGVAAIVAIELIAATAEDQVLRLPAVMTGRNALFVEAMIRTGLSLTIGFAVIAWIKRPKTGPFVRTSLIYAFAVMMIGQSAVYAAGEIGGQHMRSSGAPFQTPSRLRAEPWQFHPPSDQALAAMHATLSPDEYRTSIICLAQRAPVSCSPHVDYFWKLRSLDGYLNYVPLRPRLLPWTDFVAGPRSISFRLGEKIDWPILALANVRYVIGYDEALATNAVADGSGGFRETGPRDIKIVENPYPATPRVFFAASIRAVSASIESSTAEMFPSGTIPPPGLDVQARSVVEGFSSPSVLHFPTEGTIQARFDAQTIDITVSPLDRQRFLAVNELFHPLWRATIDGKDSPIYPTNLIMRGLLIPANATHVVLRYVPFAETPFALLILAAAVGFCVVAVMVLRRQPRRNTQSQRS